MGGLCFRRSFDFFGGLPGRLSMDWKKQQVRPVFAPGPVVRRRMAEK